MRNRPVTTLLALAAALLAGCAGGVLGLGNGWREEVELHDGRKIVVERSQTYGGRHEIGQGAPIRTQEIEFTVPGTGKRYHFKSEYSEDVGRVNLKAVALHIKDDVPYLVTVPNLCNAYNRWGRPNPPYVIFKHDGQEWTRIPLSELPAEFKTINLAVDTKNEEAKFRERGVFSAERVREFNRLLPQKEYKEILREPLPGTPDGCTRMIRVDRTGWEGLGFFSSHDSREACRNYCKLKQVADAECPCDELFERK